jgi:FAD/FMN-containing dehydrogenase
MRNWRRLQPNNAWETMRLLSRRCEMMQRTPRRRRLIAWCVVLACIVLALWVVGRPATHLVRTALRDVRVFPLLPEGVVDDASRLNRTAIAESIDVTAGAAEAEAQLAALLERARDENLRVSIAGARHTMGGHTIYPGGIALNMQPFDAMSLDEATGVLHVQSGARWDEIIPYLDAHGRSVAIMQSNNSFTVGGSLSANCHGWQPDRPPIASTVLTMRVMTADGAIVRCSRAENAELFAHVLGGYGLFGIILDVELQTVANDRYRAERFDVDAEELPGVFAREVVGASDVGMAYGRLCVAPSDFLGRAVVTLFHCAPCSPSDVPALAESSLTALKRAVFRGSAGSDYGKELRWKAELTLADRLAKTFVSRNQLLNDPVDLYQDRSEATTDILHEYFVPPGEFSQFIEAMQTILPCHDVDLLNVTVRHVLTDEDTALRYADREMLALVLLFNQPRTAEGEAAMEACTQGLIEAALEHGGRYYLPYRLHATLEQFERAYPQAALFFETKRRYDPQEIFQNQFYVKYSRPGR